jgi:hypothetical protein
MIVNKGVHKMEKQVPLVERGVNLVNSKNQRVEFITKVNDKYLFRVAKRKEGALYDVTYSVYADGADNGIQLLFEETQKSPQRDFIVNQRVIVLRPGLRSSKKPSFYTGVISSLPGADPQTNKPQGYRVKPDEEYLKTITLKDARKYHSCSTGCIFASKSDALKYIERLSKEIELIARNENTIPTLF